MKDKIYFIVISENTRNSFPKYSTAKKAYDCLDEVKAIYNRRQREGGLMGSPFLAYPNSRHRCASGLESSSFPLPLAPGDHLRSWH